MDAEFCIHMPCMGLDCIGCNAEHLANVGTIAAEGNEVEDLLFALREAVGSGDARDDSALP